MARSITRSHIALVAAIIVAVALFEFANGRPPICPCGYIKLWANSTHSVENSQMVADWYSLSHIVHGLIFFGVMTLLARRLPVGARLAIATLVEGAWELAENSQAVIDRYRATTIALGYSGDSIVNSISDVCFMIVGFLIASRLPWWGTLAFGVTLELVALAVIRDNLTLNVIMLLYPIDAIRQWQNG